MKKLLSVLALTALLVACKQGEVEVDTLDNGILPQEVVVDVLSAAQQQPAEAVLLQAKVTQDGEAVEDATVSFEIWESGKRDTGKMLEGQPVEGGVYEAEHIFEHDGVYYMYAHTNARGMHVMPKQEITVGHPDMSKVLEDESSPSMDDMPHDNNSGAAHEEEQSMTHSHQ